MEQKSLPEYFITVLTEALEADRMIRNACVAQKSKAQAQWLRQRYQADLDFAMPSIEPLDCVRMMEDEPRARVNA
jgi:ferritin-like metal-binding protein YciE